jgi:hypothetical protein
MELPVSMCSHCRGLGWDPVEDVAGALEVDERAPVVRRFTAEHKSTCPGCGEPVAPGEPLALVDGVAWVCESCSTSDGALS